MSGQRVPPWERTMRMIQWLHDRGCHKLPPLDRKLSLRQAYINEFEWVDPTTAPARELAIFTMSDKSRGLYQIMPKMCRIREHRIYEVYKNYGLSLVEWLQLPRELVANIIEDSQNELLLATAAVERKEREMAREQEKLSKQQNSNIEAKWPGN